MNEEKFGDRFVVRDIFAETGPDVDELVENQIVSQIVQESMDSRCSTCYTEDRVC